MIINDSDLKKNFIQEYIKEFQEFSKYNEKNTIQDMNKEINVNRDIIEFLLSYIFIVLDELIFEYVSKIGIYIVAPSPIYYFSGKNYCNYIQIKLNHKNYININFSLNYNYPLSFINSKPNIEELKIGYCVNDYSDFASIGFDFILKITDFTNDKDQFKNDLLSIINKVNNIYNKEILRSRKIKKII